MSTETACLTEKRERCWCCGCDMKRWRLVRAAKPATKAARRSSPRMYRQKRENSALAARHCATATAVKKRIASEENTISCSQTDPTMVGWFSGSSGVCWYVAKKELACAEHAATLWGRRREEATRASTPFYATRFHYIDELERCVAHVMR